MGKYKKEIIILSICLIVCIIAIFIIKNIFFANKSATGPINNIVNDIKGINNEGKYKEAITVPNEVITTNPIVNNYLPDDEEVKDEVITKYPYEVAPQFIDDGSIIYDGMTLTELTNKLNKSLNGYMTNTGYFFALYTKNTGLDPYLSVAIVLLETGCKWSCSKLTKECNNIGGLKGSPSCNGKSYKKYNTLGEGIDGYLDIIYKNYYLQGLKTPEEMGPKYAASITWAEKVRSYMNEIKDK